MSIFGQSQRAKVIGITPAELKEALQKQPSPLVVDVRERWEYEHAHIEGAQLLPLDDLYSSAPALPQEREIVVYCHHGMRSAAAARLLMKYNYPNVKNLLGGIDRWAVEIDRSLPRY